MDVLNTPPRLRKRVRPDGYGNCRVTADLRSKPPTPLADLDGMLITFATRTEAVQFLKPGERIEPARID